MRIPPKLTMCCAFDSRLGKKEGFESEKIMYFYPSEQHSVEHQCKMVGLAEALHCQKHRTSFYEAEPEIWFMMEFQNPSFAQNNANGAEATVTWCEEELDDLLLQTLVMQSYKLFRMFNGSFKLITEKSGVEGLKKKLSVFMPQLLATMNVDQIDIFDTLNGINFLPVDKIVYSKIQTFINITENTFPHLKYSSFLFKDHLVYSGLELDDMQVLYRCLSNYWLEEKDKKNQISFPFPVNKTQTHFVTGPENLDDADSPISIPSVFISPTSEEYGLVIYQYRDVICLFLFEIAALSDRSLYRTIHAYIAPQLQTIVKDLGVRKPQGTEDPYKYLYFNHMNLALKSSLSKKVALPRETLRLLHEMHNDFEHMQENVSEVMIRTQGDAWIVARKSDQRELYVIFDNRNDNLLEVNEEIKRFNSTYFGNIFLD